MRCWFLLQTTWHETNSNLILLCSPTLSMLSSQQVKIEGTQHQPVPDSRAAENSKAPICFSQLLKVLAQQNPRRASWAWHPLALFISFRNNFSENMFPFYRAVPGNPGSTVLLFSPAWANTFQLLITQAAVAPFGRNTMTAEEADGNCDNSLFSQLIWSSKR